MFKKKIFTEIRPAGEVNKEWNRIKISANGQYCLACVNGGFVYLSSDYGATWLQVDIGSEFGNYWYALSVCATGQYMYAGVPGGRLYRSDDYGATWAEVQPAGNASKGWTGASQSEDGKIVYLCANSGHIYKSINYGVNWTDIDLTAIDWSYWSEIDCSKNGQYIVVESYGSLGIGAFCMSSNYGVDWEQKHPEQAMSVNWYDICISYTGQYIMICSFDDGLFLSTDYGVTFNKVCPKVTEINNIISCCISDNGQYMYAGQWGGLVYWSQNYGVNWSPLRPDYGKIGNYESLATDSTGNYFYCSVNSARIWQGINNPYLWPKIYTNIYQTIGLTARGSLSKLWIHQTTKHGKRVLKYYYPPNPRTADQQSNRSLLYQAVKNWQGFDYPTKDFYNTWAKRRPMLGYNRYISLYLKANKNMIIYWKTLELDANDTRQIPDYIYQQLPSWLPTSPSPYWENLNQKSGSIVKIPDYIASDFAPKIKRALNSDYLGGYPANPYPTSNSIPVLNSSGLLPEQLLLKSKLIEITRDATAASGDVSYTGIGFKPTSMLSLFSVAATVRRGQGFADSLRVSGATYMNWNDLYYTSTAFIIFEFPTSGYPSQVAFVKSYDDDGFTLTWIKGGTPAAQQIIAKIICFR